MQNQLTKGTSPPAARVVIVMGVSGCGKSTVGALLASRLRWEFEDADWFHPAANVDKMHSGIALTDEDRWPWLAAVAAWIDKTRCSGGHDVIACSALKRRYRDVLIGDRGDVAGVVMMVEQSALTLGLLYWLFLRSSRQGEQARERLDLTRSHTVWR